MIDQKLKKAILEASKLISDLGYLAWIDEYEAQSDSARYIVSFDTDHYIISFIIYNFDDFSYDIFDKNSNISIPIHIFGKKYQIPKKFSNIVVEHYLGSGLI